MSEKNTLEKNEERRSVSENFGSGGTQQDIEQKILQNRACRKCRKKHRRHMTVSFILIVCIAVAFMGVPRIKLYLDSRKDAQPAPVELSRFKTDLLAAIDTLSAQSGTKYVLDEEYYNEADSVTYVSTANMTGEDEITQSQIYDCIFTLFDVATARDGTKCLIQKNRMSLIGEADNKGLMNMLDYKFIGLTTSEIEAQSKGLYISQNNPAYLEMPYGSSNVWRSGCGPVALTMGLNYVAGFEAILLTDVVSWANEHNMYAENSGTKWALMNQYPPTVGYKCEELYIPDVQTLSTVLSEGEVLVAIMRKGHFTDGGHFILITDITDNTVTVLDPSSIYRSLQKWDIELILDESRKNFWKIYR